MPEDLNPPVPAPAEPPASPAVPPEPTLPSTEPTPAGAETKPSEPTPEAPKPEGEEKPPEPTPFEKLVSQTKDSDERIAMIQRAIDGLPDEQRERLPALQARLAQAQGVSDREQAAAQERSRQEAVRGAEDKRTSAQGQLNDHLLDVLKRASDPDREGEINYDPAVINGSIDNLVAAEVYLQNQNVRQFFSEAVLSRLHELGDPISEERYTEMARWADGEGQQKQGMVGAYLDEMISRAEKRGYERRDVETKAELERFKKSELSAFLEGKMREANLEPDTGKPQSGRGGSFEDLERKYAHTPLEMTPEEMSAYLSGRRERRLPTAV